MCLAASPTITTIWSGSSAAARSASGGSTPSAECARSVPPRADAPRHTAEQPKQKRRERIRVSNAVVLGFGVAAVMVIALLMSYAQLSMISQEVVREQKRLTVLQEEHVKLVARYERTFDLTSIKEAAEASGMAKPSASQIYYVDLSAPDNVVLYGNGDGNPLKHVFAAVGQNVGNLVEYFK